MPILVTADAVRVVAGTTVVLDDVSLGVSTGERIGVVGRNGSGKSTLLRVLAGTQLLDGGRTARAGGATGPTVAFLTQADTLVSDETVRYSVVGHQPDHAWAADPRVQDILGGLLGGLDGAGVGGLDRTVGPLSGGERRRVALAAALIADPDLLLLDEPTNHLDIEGVAWLAAYLATRRADSATVTVTHDRWFLDATSTSTWEVGGGQVAAFDGGYAAYVLAKAERDRLAGLAGEKRNNLLRKELAWLRRGAPARSSKPRFRLDAAAALIADEPPPRESVELQRFAVTRLGKDVVDLEDATVVLGGRTILDRVTWRLAPGERVGLVGVNGAGKSTAVKALLGLTTLASGRCKQGRTVVAAYLSQEVRELDTLLGHTVLEAVTDVRAMTRLGDKDVTASQLATRLGFVGGRQQTRVGDLSGGERRRLQLLRLLMTEPNVIVLDEPTNDLDIETLTSLEDLLDGWAGTLVVISHDRYLLERTTDHQLALLGDGLVRDLPGGVDEYLRLRADSVREGNPPQRRSAPPSSARDAATARQARKDMARLERRMTAIGRDEERIHARMVERADDYEEMGRLHEELLAAHAERENVERAWLEAAETAEAAEATASGHGG